MHREHHGFLLGILAALMISISGALIRAAQSIPFETMVFARFAISLCFVLPAIWMGRVPFKLSNLGKHFSRAIFGLLSLYCYFYSILHMPLVNALTFFNTAPLFLPLVVFVWMNHVIPRMRIFALILGFAGVIVILRPTEGSLSIVSLIGLIGGLFSAISQLGVRQLSKVESTETILSYYFIISTLISFFPMVYNWKPIEAPIFWFLLLLIGFSSLIYQYLLTRSLTHAPATKVSTMNYLSVIFSGLFGWWFFHEVPSLWVVGGVFLIVGGGVIALLSKEEPSHLDKD